MLGGGAVVGGGRFDDNASRKNRKVFFLNSNPHIDLFPISNSHISLFQNWNPPVIYCFEFSTKIVTRIAIFNEICEEVNIGMSGHVPMSSFSFLIKFDRDVVGRSQYKGKYR